VIATGRRSKQHFERLAAIRAQAERPLFMCVDTAYRPLLSTVSGLTLWSPLTSVSASGTAAADTLAIPLVYLPMVDPVRA
jgi:hypothetical protein